MRFDLEKAPAELSCHVDWWSWFAAQVAADRAPYSAAAAEVVLAVLQAGQINPEVVLDTVLKFLQGDRAFAALWFSGKDIHDGRLRRDLSEPNVVHVLGSNLARFLLANFILPNATLETLLTQVRRMFALKAARADFVPSDNLAFYCALAEQCFLNEYIYWIEPDEEIAVEILLANLEAMLIECDPFLEAAVTALACYRRLADLPFAETLLGFALKSPISSFRSLIAHAVDEPLQELKISQSLPRITPIHGDTSEAVRKMYEENPYPRWRLDYKIPSRPPLDVVRDFFVGADTASFLHIREPRILIAGCGTGKAIIAFAGLFTDCDVTAIDLSRASLAYAKRQTATYGMKVAFAQADILELPDVRASYDFIECVGVLHHMADVEEGWRALAACLRPGGLMRVGLYNRGARDWISAARRFVAAGNYPATSKGIRNFRHNVLQTLGGADPFPSVLEPIISCPDFYSISACRDLCFHVQETEFTFAEIMEMINRLGLKFLGVQLEGGSGTENLQDLEKSAGYLYVVLLQRPDNSEGRPY